MKIAVIGSGVSGLQRHGQVLLNEYSDHEVHLYEADSRPGGHAHTFQPLNYPNFLRFLHLYPTLADAVQPTSMTFSVSRNFGAFEWAGNEHGCGRSLRPMTSAIWSTPPDKCALDFPAKTLIRFMHNHHLLQITGKPDWLTLRGGSKVYVNKIISSLPPSVSTTTLSSALSSFSTVTQVQLETTTGETNTFDHVILASGSGGSDKEREREKEVLGAFGWNRNEVVLHSDVRLMPMDRMTWSCWNYLIDSGELSRDEEGEKKLGGDKVALLDERPPTHPHDYHGPVLVTLNPQVPFEPRPETVVGRWKYDHPVLDANAIRAQNSLPTIQAKRGISYAGAYLRYGFHEDGFTSGLRAVMGIPGGAEGALRMPFDVLEAESEPEEVWAEKVFVVLEGYGVRKHFESLGTHPLQIWPSYNSR
ncbi:hypothetical protein BC629DRAFT_1641522 [Irpex lacteus]|nr:hypothetical protein BC629DRAFT_1641522 [Irpex lacteus]